MASSPYTFRIAYAEGSAKVVTYTVPEHKRVVVTNVAASAGGSSGSQVFVGVHGIYPYTFFAPAPYAADRAAVKLVAYERETITLITVGSDTRAVVTGYIFEDTEGKPAAAAVDVRALGEGEQLPAGALAAGGAGDA